MNDRGVDGETGDGTDDGRTTPRRSRVGLVIGIVAGALVASGIAFVAISLTPGSDAATAGPTGGSTRTSATPRAATATPATPPPTTATPTASPVPSPTARAATPPPQDAAAPAPFITPVAAGTVVAEGDVASPKGSVHFHYRIMATGDDTYTTQWSNFTSTLPVTVGVSFFAVAPSVGDGLTDQGEGRSELGGATAGPTSSSGTLGTVSQPSYLGSLVVATTSAPADTPVEIGVGKVLAVTAVRWSVPPRATNIVPADSGAAPFATGALQATTASGAPKRYTVAPDDLIDAVARRFGISVSALIYMNQGLQVIDAEQHLFEGTTLVLDPDSV
ncbi:LysM peptidoglycan-binding domain-containing protein [Frigoribacterium sp. 2-23]|uniref:LysM peptidoglycan-binding domain-containing protein n=1 Tax=Frigoribacterium sp. 2-23 TaxID=3415006 RepID=UPI003C6ED0BE